MTAIIQQLAPRHTLQARIAGWDRLFARCPGMRFYLRNLLSIYSLDSDEQIAQAVAAWESGAPRPVQRRELIGQELDEPHEQIVAFGRLSGTGKTTAALERIWHDTVTCDGVVCGANRQLPLTLTGHAFARRVAGQVRDLDRLMDELIEPDWLLIDDLDKRGNADGQFSAVVQQSLLDLVEARSVEGQATVLTLNSTGSELMAKFDESIGPYLLRRLRERFVSIDFDPVL